MKKYFWIVLCIIVISAILIIINNKLYGTDKIYIADYMPGFTSPYVTGESKVREYEEPWEITKLKRTLFDMIIAFVEGIALSTIASIALYKTKILESKRDRIYIVLIYIIPLLIAGIKLSMIYDYTC